MKKEKKGGLAYRLFMSVWRRKWRVVLSALLVAACVMLYGVFSTLSKATTYIKLDFETAHDGLTPAGTRFNIYDIKSEKLLTEAIRLTGLEGELTWRELADCMTVSPSRTQSVSKRYIATEYNASVQWQKSFGRVSARSMLDVICRLYYEDFLVKSGMNHAQLDVDWSELEGMEYAEVGDFVKTRADILRQFLQTRMDNSAGYDSDDSTLSFRALLNTIETFQTVYIDKFTALVTQSRLFKDVASYKSKLTYQRLLIDQNYQLSRAQYAIREEALKDYQASLIAIVMVPTYYSGNGLYMSRTQTGIDTLTKAAESYSLVSQKQALKLAQIDKSIASLALARAGSTDKADALLANITRQFDALLERVKRADDEYVAYTARDYVSFQSRSVGIMDAYSVKRAVLAAGAWALSLDVLFILFDSRRRTRDIARVAKGRRDTRA